MAIGDHHKRTLISSGTLTNANQEPINVFLKVYASRSSLCSGIFRHSRGWREAQHLQAFTKWGINAPDVIAYGARRRYAGLGSELSFIMTKAIPEALELRELWKNPDEPGDTDIRLKLIAQLADQTRRLHARRFYHQDLKWRNLLVTPSMEIYWIDCPNGYHTRLAPRQRHGCIKDLATLDKVAKDRCTEEERLRFVQHYLKEHEINDRVRQFAGKVTRYRRRRQDD